jgi:hypothetical protein
VHKGSLFSTSSPALVIFSLFDNSHSYLGEMIAHCGLDLHFPDDYWCWPFFMYLLAICMSSFEKCLLKCTAYLYMGCVCVCIASETLDSLTYSASQCHVRCIVYKFPHIFSALCWLFFFDFECVCDFM